MFCNRQAIVLLLLSAILSVYLPGKAQIGSDSFESMQSENRQLKERLHFLESRRESFRWGRFEQMPLLRSGSVMHATATPEGRIAFATDTQGLIFFNGTFFESLNSGNSPLTDNYVTAVAPLPGNRAYIGTGSGMIFYMNGKLSEIPGLPEELASGPISCLQLVGTSELWAGTQGAGVWRLDQSGWQNWRMEGDSAGLTGNDINAMVYDPTASQLWAATAGGGVCRYAGGVWESFPEPLGPGSDEVYTLALDSDGLVWAGTVAAGAGFWDGRRWRKAPLPLPENEGVVNITVLSGGDLFFGSTAGSYVYSRLSGDWLRLPVPEELAPYPVISAAESAGRLWLSPSGQGLYLYDRGVVSRYSTENGLPSDIPYHIAGSKDGRIWVCTWNGIGIFDGQKWTRMGLRDGLPDDIVTFVLFADDSTTYFGTHGGLAVLKNGNWKTYSRDNGLQSNTVNHLALDSSGKLWISTEGGVTVLDGDSVKTYNKEDGLPSSQVQSTAHAPDGTAWVATNNGLAGIRNGQITRIDAANQRSGVRLPGSYHFTSVKLAGDGSLWAATNGNGVWQRKPGGRWQSYTVENGLSANVVYAIEQDSDGKLLFGTEMGLSLFDGTHWRSYSTSDGLNPGAITAVSATGGDSLWLGSVDQGVVCYDRSRFLPPETYIHIPGGAAVGLDAQNRTVQLVAADSSQAPVSGVEAGEGRYYLDSRNYLSASGETAPDTIRENKLTLTATAMTPWWSSPAILFRFSYKLDNAAWSEFTYGGTIGLFDLQRGAHRLYVRAKGPHLKIDPTPAFYSFYVDVPTIWSDWRIYAAGVIAVLIICALIWRRSLAWYFYRLRHRYFKPVTPNPFNPNIATVEKERFFGRDEIFESLRETLTTEQGSVIIQGSEKIGVTSFLFQAAEAARREGAAVTYLDLAQSYFAEVSSLIEQLFVQVARETGSQRQEPEEGEISIGDFRELFANFSAPVVLIFDNAELLGRLLQRDEEEGAELLSCFRELVLGGTGTSFLFGLESLKVFREHAGVLFDMSRVFSLGVLSEEEARSIIRRPLEGRVFFREEALELLVRLAGGHPFLLHSIGKELVEQLNRQQTNLCTLDSASSTVERLLESPPIILLDLWEELTKREKLLLAATVSANTSGLKHFSLSLSDITQILVSRRISLLEVELAKASTDLARRELLFLDDDGNRIRVEDSLLGRWIAVNQDIELIDTQEEYDVGEALRKLGDELARSFRMEELSRRVLGFLESLLHFEWSALLTTLAADPGGEEVHVAIIGKAGAKAEEVELPDMISRESLEKLSLQGEALIVDQDGGSENGESANGWPFEPDTLLVPLLIRGAPAGLIALGKRRDGERYSRRDRIFVETITEQVAVSMENVRLYEEETEKERLKQELETARNMQLAILPERKPDFPDLDIYAYLNPATEVGGDYFDYSPLDGGKLMFIVGDVSGHGISAGTLVYMSKSCIYNQIRTDYGVEKVMEAMNDMVYGALSERMLMTLCYTIFDLKARTLTYSIAGHPFPYHYSTRKKTLEELELSAYPLGVTSKASYKVKQVRYAPGDVFVFYSDGIIEAVNPEGEQFGFSRFEQLVKENSGLDAESINFNITMNFRHFQKGVPQDDDVTLVIIKAK